MRNRCIARPTSCATTHQRSSRTRSSTATARCGLDSKSRGDLRRATSPSKSSLASSSLTNSSGRHLNGLAEAFQGLFMAFFHGFTGILVGFFMVFPLFRMVFIQFSRTAISTRPWSRRAASCCRCWSRRRKTCRSRRTASRRCWCGRSSASAPLGARTNEISLISQLFWVVYQRFPFRSGPAKRFEVRVRSSWWAIKQ